MSMKKRTRILYVENGIGYGGAIICLRHLVRHLDRDRFEPMVITGRTGEQYREIANEADWRHIPDRHVDVIGLQRMLAALHWPDSIPGARFLLKQLLARLDDIANFAPFFLHTLWTTWRFKPSLIHVNNEPLCNRAALLAGKILGIPVVCHVRGDQQGSWMMRWLYGLPACFIAVSEWISNSIGRMNVPASKRTVIYDGIELQKLDLYADGFAFRKKYSVPQEAFAVGLVGLLIPWKGQRLFLEAARQLLQEIPDLHLLIVGGTPDECQPFEQELRAIARENCFHGKVIFTGHVVDMPSVYNSLDVVVSASTSPEPLGTMIIECLTMARALVAPRHGGAVEMVDHERTGLLFTPNDAADLARQIKRFYDDEGLRKKLGSAARIQALATFSVEEHAHQVQQVYEKLLRKKM